MRKPNRTLFFSILIGSLLIAIACGLPQAAGQKQAEIPPTNVPAAPVPTVPAAPPPAPAPEVAVTLPSGMSVSGTWQGTLNEIGGSARKYTFKADLKQSPGEQAVSGQVEMILPPNSGGETYMVTGTLVGNTLHLQETQGRFFFGSLEGDSITGQAAWNCFDCEGWGKFELTRGTTASLPPTPAVTFAPSDIPFNIDCSALTADRKADCDSFIMATRDQVYPILRDLTGVTLSKCYDAVYYKIFNDDPAPGAGGFSAGNKISYNKRYSIDLPYKYDPHELLHTVSSCTGALDAHVFHGMILNEVYDRMGVSASGYFTARENPQGLIEYQMEKIKTASPEDKRGLCMGLLSNKVTIAYFDLGSKAIAPLYKSTVNPHPSSAPNQKLIDTWGQQSALKVQALLETLNNNFKYSLNIPECGY